MRKRQMQTYCTQNNGDCRTCALVNHGRDCRNNLIAKREEICASCGLPADNCRCDNHIEILSNYCQCGEVVWCCPAHSPNYYASDRAIYLAARAKIADQIPF